MRSLILSFLLLVPGMGLAENMDVTVILCDNDLDQFLVEVKTSFRGPGRSAPQGCSLVTQIEGIKYPYTGSSNSFFTQNPGNLADIFAQEQANSNFGFHGMSYDRQFDYEAFSVVCPSISFFVIKQNFRGPGGSPSYLNYCRKSNSIYFTSSRVLQGVYENNGMTVKDFLNSKYSEFINLLIAH